jgi:hypothetical protein
MSDPVTILTGEPTNKGLDYAYLKDEGLTLVQQLAGEIWTDYNEHDPGVTTLEQLCYALTELSYRAELPFADLLTDKQSGSIDPQRQALFIPRRILPCNPLTLNDYRKLIVDRVPQVANAWLQPHPTNAAPTAVNGLTPPTAVNGLYDITLYVPGADPWGCDEQYQPAVVRRRVRRVFSRRRNLCEDVHSVFILKPERAVVNACAAIDDALAPEAILANIFFRLGNFLAPELRRQSLKSLLDAGRSTDEIFNGPLLHNGFIADEQLQPKATAINVQELIRVIARSPGVTGVSGVSVAVGRNGATYTGNNSIPISARKVLQLFTRRDPKLGGFTIRLTRNGSESRPDPARVQRELDKLWSGYRRTHKLKPHYEEFFSLPKGQWHDVEEYYSIQSQYPNVYGINAFGLPDDASETRQAQARQLKGYLLVYDQLLANFFAQLAHAKNLYSIDDRLPQTYFYQYLRASVPGVAPLLGPDYESGLPRIVAGQDKFTDRRNRFLDFLLALYAEKLDASSISAQIDQDGLDVPTGARLIQAKLTLLHHFVASTHDRGRGFDYLASPATHALAGMEIKCRIQLGMDVSDHRPLIDLLDEFALEVVESNAAASVGRTVTHHSDYIDEHFEPVTSFAARTARPTDQASQRVQMIPLLRGQRVTEEFLSMAGRIENFRLGSLPGEDAVAVVCKSAAATGWHPVWKYPDLESARAAAYALVDTVQSVNRHRQQLYIVEHTLLRFGRAKPNRETQDDSRDASDFVYSFTLTAVVSTSTNAASGQDYQAAVREVIRQNTPAHIAVDYCFLDLQQMRLFESLYWSWRRALRQRRSPDIIFTSAQLRSFLRRCGCVAVTSTPATEEGVDQP